MEQNTPEEESKLLPLYDGAVVHYKYIHQKIAAYKGFRIDDILVEQGSNFKFKITYIDSFGLIYGRRIILTGALGKNILHITGHHNTFILDPDQANAILLGEAYDPVAKAKQESKDRRKASRERNKKIGGRA